MEALFVGGMMSIMQAGIQILTAPKPPDIPDLEDFLKDDDITSGLQADLQERRPTRLTPPAGIAPPRFGGADTPLGPN